MTCPFHKSALNAVSVAAQTIAENGYLAFERNRVLTGCAIQHASGVKSIVIGKAGLYVVNFNADVLPTTAAPITIRLVSNGEVVPGAEATFTGVADTTESVSFQTLLKVLPNCWAVDNTKALQVQATAAATISNANISVVKLA